jgi:hypothetical protein
VVRSDHGQNLEIVCSVEVGSAGGLEGSQAAQLRILAVPEIVQEEQTVTIGS